VAKLNPEEAKTDYGASDQHQSLMVGGAFLLPDFEFSELVQPRQAAFDEPTRFPKMTAVGRPSFGQQRLYPLFFHFPAVRLGIIGSVPLDLLGAAA